MSTNDNAGSELLEELSLDLEELAGACGAEPASIAVRVHAALLAPRDGEPSSWRFGSADLRRARRMAEAERMFDINEDAAAFIADLLEEIDRLRQR